MSYGVGLTAAMQQALADGLYPYLFAEIDHPDGMVWLWDGIGDVVWDGKTFLGKGGLGGLTQVSETQDLQIQDRVLWLRGVNPADLQFLTSDIRNRVATCWLGCVREGVVVRDPYLLDEIQMDSQSFPVDETGGVMIKITGYSGLWTLERAQDLAWSPEEAKKIYPDETGFDLIPSLQNKLINWTDS